MKLILVRLLPAIAVYGFSACLFGDHAVSTKMPPLFDTQFLSKPEAVANFLIEKGFEVVTIPSENLSLEGFFLNRGGEKTVIAIAGFLPGKITGMATLYELLPESYNILLINLRGKGNSNGRSGLYKIWRYGINEYKDVCAAIAFAHKKVPHAKIILHGICAGGFHAMKALAYLADTNEELYAHVEHAIIDSSFPSIEETGRTALCSEIEKRYRNMPLGSILTPVLKTAYLCINRCILSPLMWLNRDELTITGEMIQKASKNCTFLFIHGTHDAYAPVEKIQALMAHMSPDRYSVHYFDTHSHASLHLKFTDIYTELLRRSHSFKRLYSNSFALAVLARKKSY